MIQPVRSMTHRTLSGLFWMSLATGANVVVLLVVLVVLARLLTPADFGLAAAALMVIGFTAIFAELGVGPAVVQRADLQPAHVQTAFTLAVGLGLLFCGLSYLAAPLVARCFGLEELTPLLRISALFFPIQSLGIIAEALLHRDLRFRCVAGVDTVAALLGYAAVSITLAYLGFAAWALVCAYLAQTFIRSVLLFAIHPHPVWPAVQRKAWRDLLGFGGGFTAGRFSNYLAGQGENLVIGAWLGPVALGIYGRAYQLMAGPAVLFGNVLDRVLFPAMAHVQDQPKRLADAYRRGSALIALVILPISAVIVVLAPEVIHIVLGSEWNAVVVPLQILGVGMLFRTSCKISDSLVRATGAVHRRTWRQTVYALAVVAGAWLGQHWGIEGVAVAILGTLALNFFLMAHLSLCEARMTWGAFAGAHVAGLALAAIVAVPVFLVAFVLRTRGAPPILILVTSMAATLPSLIAMFCFPKVFLGQDGQWMVRKVRVLLSEVLLPASPDGTMALGEAAPIPVSVSESHPLPLLVRALRAEGVRYCRWKSQVNSKRLLSGRGDLDLLVHPRDARTFLRVAEGLGFKQVVDCFEPPTLRQAHLYGLDRETGVLVHVHVNFALLEQGPTPLDDLVLQNCKARDESGPLADMPVVDASAEAIVLVLRTTEQHALLHAFRHVLATRDKNRNRLQFLLAADGHERRRVLFRRWLPSEALPAFEQCLDALVEPASVFRTWLLARRLHKQLRMPGRASDVGWHLGLLAFVRKACWRLRHQPGSPKRLPSGGAVIAFIGPDASGKSTMVVETAAWLGQVFRVRTAHLGKPPSTWLTLLPNCSGRLLGRLAPGLRTFHRSSSRESAERSQAGLLHRFRAVLLAWDRCALAKRLARQAARGWIVVTDRYPTDVVGAPDSARLECPENSGAILGLSARLARLEHRWYREVPLPDLVFRLNAPLGAALDRNRHRQKRGKEGDDFIARRHREFFVPPFADVPVLELDTSMSPQDSIRVLRERFWDWLCRSALQQAPPTETSSTLPRLITIEDEKVELQSR